MGPRVNTPTRLPNRALGQRVASVSSFADRMLHCRNHAGEATDERVAMRNSVWMGVSVAALAVASYGYVAFSPSASVSIEARQAGNAARPSAARPERTMAQHLQGARLDRLEGEVSTLDERLAAMEAKVIPRQPEAQADAAAQRIDANSPEARLAGQMIRILGVESPNREWSERVKRAMLDGTSTVEGMDLESLRCGQRFCQASFFIKEGGDMIALRKLMELPIIEGEAFTVSEADGRMSLFFGAPGVSLHELDPELGDEQRSLITTTLTPRPPAAESELD